MPPLPGPDVVFCELAPVGPQRLVKKRFLGLVSMGVSTDQLEEGGADIEWRSSTDNNQVLLVNVLEGHHERIVGLLDPCAIVDDAFTLEATKLQGHVRRVLHYHIGARGYSCDVLEVGPHEGVA